MRTTVTQLNANELDRTWPLLVAHTRANEAEFVLLPELPFGPWLAATDGVDPAAWDASVVAHEQWQERLGELGAPVVVGTRPVIEGDCRYNEAFVWRNGTISAAHRKTYLPDEPGFWEATWYDRGPVVFEVEPSAFGDFGIQICTEMWFFEHARDYAAAGVRLILTPRATEARTLAKWQAGGQVSAVTAGAFALSSNHSGSYAGVDMGGGGWIMSPDGVVLATTGDTEPFVTIDLDLGLADVAKTTYPRYVITSQV